MPAKTFRLRTYLNLKFLKGLLWTKICIKAIIRGAHQEFNKTMILYLMTAINTYSLLIF